MSRRPGSPGFVSREADWLSIDEARTRISANAVLLESESVSLHDALGRALAEDVRATATLPPWDNSAMDGYAVRAADIEGATESDPVALPVVGVSYAGRDTDPSVEPGEAVRIMTGAPIPRGADTVVRVEDTDAEGDEGVVRILHDRDRGRHVRPAGQDMRSGELLLRGGQSVTPGAVGVLAAAGRAAVTVRRAATVALLGNGDELRRPDRYDDVRAGRGIPDSNVPMLSAMSTAAGAVPIDLGIAADSVDSLKDRIRSASDADVLVTSGGASMGEADLVKRVLDGLGFELDFWRVKMRPGSPISFGWLPVGDRRQPVFGLPGNPSSAFVTFEIFVRPYLMRLAGHERVERTRVTCVSAGALDAPAPLTYFQRVTLARDGERTLATLAGPQLSGLVTGLARADGLAVIPPEIDRVAPGEVLEVMLLDGTT